MKGPRFLGTVGVIFKVNVFRATTIIDCVQFCFGWREYPFYICVHLFVNDQHLYSALTLRVMTRDELAATASFPNGTSSHPVVSTKTKAVGLYKQFLTSTTRAPSLHAKIARQMRFVVALGATHGSTAHSLVSSSRGMAGLCCSPSAWIFDRSALLTRRTTTFVSRGTPAMPARTKTRVTGLRRDVLGSAARLKTLSPPLGLPRRNSFCFERPRGSCSNFCTNSTKPQQPAVAPPLPAWMWARQRFGQLTSRWPGCEQSSRPSPAAMVVR